MRSVVFVLLFLLSGGAASAQTWTILKQDGPGGESSIERERMTLEEAERGARETREAQRQAAEEALPRVQVEPGGREMDWTVLEVDDGSGGRARVVQERATLEQALDAASAGAGATREENGDPTVGIPSGPGEVVADSVEDPATHVEPARPEDSRPIAPHVEFLHDPGPAVPRSLEPGDRAVPYPRGGRVIYTPEPDTGREP